MARIVGVDLPRTKRIEIALTYLFGIGLHRSRLILSETQIDPDKRAGDLVDDEVARLTKCIQNQFKIEGDLRRETFTHIRRLMDVGCHRGTRHKRGLPARGQRTKTNARTRKGPRPRVGGRKTK